MSKKKGMGKFVAGAIIGAGLGILFAPKSGSETRKELSIKIKDLLSKTKDIDVNEVKENIVQKIEEIKKELNELDKEKVMSIAKEKGNDIKKKADELVALAKEKGTPVLEKAADEVREKAIVVVKEVLDKLENPKKKSK